MRSRFFLILGLVVLLAAPAFSDALDPSRIGMGARSLGMGRAQAAAEDLGSIFVNPANAAALTRFSLTSMFTRIMEDVNYSMLGAAFPLREGTAGTLAFSYMGIGVSDIAQTRLDSDSRPVLVDTFDYSNQLMVFSYAKEITEQVAWGGSFKLFLRDFAGINQGSASGFDLDLGVLMQLSHNLRCGVSLQNLLPPAMAGLYWGTNLKEDIPLNMKIGMGYNPRKDILLLGDVDSLGNLHFGAEWMPREMLALRAGTERIPVTNWEAVMNYTMGVGLKLGGVNLDYAYYLDSTLDANSSHYMSLGIEFPPREIESRPVIPAQNEAEEELMAEQKGFVIPAKRAVSSR